MAKGHQIAVILPAHPTQRVLQEWLQDIHVSTSIVRYAWWVHSSSDSLYRQTRRLVRHFLAAKDIVQILRQTRPDLVVTNTLSTPVGALASKWAALPHIWYIHEFGREDHNQLFDWGDSLSTFLINKLSSRIIVNSLAVRHKFQRYIPAGKFRLVYCAVEVPPQPDQPPRNDRVFKLILVGTKSPAKRQEDAIRAVSLLARQGLDVRLTLLGGEQREYASLLRQLVRDLGVKDLVESVPSTHDPFSYVASSDVALMCSRFEAFGRVTVEAMKLGKPVIGADSGGTTELIKAGWNGLLYRPGDAEDLARKIETLYHNRPLLAEMGENAREWSNRTFTTERHVSSLLAVFDEVLELGS